MRRLAEFPSGTTGFDDCKAEHLPSNHRPYGLLAAASY
jgi:hypothetical protein